MASEDDYRIAWAFFETMSVGHEALSTTNWKTKKWLPLFAMLNSTFLAALALGV
jgi:hypothetical protein